MSNAQAKSTTGPKCPPTAWCGTQPLPASPAAVKSHCCAPFILECRHVNGDTRALVSHVLVRFGSANMRMSHALPAPEVQCPGVAVSQNGTPVRAPNTAKVAQIAGPSISHALLAHPQACANAQPNNGDMYAVEHQIDLQTWSFPLQLSQLLKST